MNIRPDIPTETVRVPFAHQSILIKLADGPDPHQKAAAFAADLFDRANKSAADVGDELNRAKKQHAKDRRALDRAEKRHERTPEKESAPTRQALYAHSFATLAFIYVGVFFLLLEPGMSVYSAAKYLSSSGLLPSLSDSTWAAVPFCSLFAIGIYYLAAWAEGGPRPIDDARLLRAVGALCVIGVVIFFAAVFNFAAIEPPPVAAALGAAVATPVPTINPFVAITLTATQLLSLVVGGGGLVTLLHRLADRNKVVHETPNHEYDRAQTAVETLQERVDAQEAVIGRLESYLRQRAELRAKFVSETATRATDIRDLIHAKGQRAQADAMREARAALAKAPATESTRSTKERIDA